jgi:major membrane immunogen (membrane-anchored lipoprotein)
MKRVGWAALALACLLVACERTSDGVPVAGEQPTAATSSVPSATTQRTQEADQSAPGVVPTTRAPVPPNTIACSQPIKPAVRMTAEVEDRHAPRITVGVPEGWSMTAGSGDVGGRLEGPRGMWAAVTIAQTQLDPTAAFRKYADGLMEKSAVSSVSIMPGELCGYSGQKLIGAWSDTPQNAVEFEDRIAHVWTNSGNSYLVAVHVEAPTGTPGFDAASSLLTEDFEIGLP